MGVILAAVYLLYMWNKVFMGEVTHEENLALPPLRWNETLSLVTVVILALLIGVFPRPFFGYMDQTSGQVAAQLQSYIPPAQNVQAAPAQPANPGGSQ